MADSPSRREVKLARIEAFSDGVIAIAITLLAFNVRVPSADDIAASGTLFNALRDQWEVYFAYTTSFITLGVNWIGHNLIFNHIRKTDNLLVLLNTLLLMCITLVPFTTSLLADYVRTPNGNTAAMIYSGLYVVIALLFNGLWAYAARRGLLTGDTEMAWVRQTTRSYLLIIPFSLLSVGVATFSVVLCLAMHLGLTAAFIVLRPHEDDAEAALQGGD